MPKEELVLNLPSFGLWEGRSSLKSRIKIWMSCDPWHTFSQLTDVYHDCYIAFVLINRSWQFSGGKSCKKEYVFVWVGNMKGGMINWQRAGIGVPWQGKELHLREAGEANLISTWDNELFSNRGENFCFVIESLRP
jgi:hypothetical protein